jgi:hypothetical protein
MRYPLLIDEYSQLELWRDFRTRVAGEGRTVRWVLMELVGYYARHGLPK